MKHPGRNFIQLSKDYKHYGLDANGIMLLLELKYCESLYCGKEKESFTRTDEQLADALAWDIKRVKRTKRELKRSGIIETRLKTMKGTRQKITEYTLFV